MFEEHQPALPGGLKLVEDIECPDEPCGLPFPIGNAFLCRQIELSKVAREQGDASHLLDEFEHRSATCALDAGELLDDLFVAFRLSVGHRIPVPLIVFGGSPSSTSSFMRRKTIAGAPSTGFISISDSERY